MHFSRSERMKSIRCIFDRLIYGRTFWLGKSMGEGMSSSPKDTFRRIGQKRGGGVRKGGLVGKRVPGGGGKLGLKIDLIQTRLLTSYLHNQVVEGICYYNYIEGRTIVSTYDVNVLSVYAIIIFTNFHLLIVMIY